MPNKGTSAFKTLCWAAEENKAGRRPRGRPPKAGKAEHAADASRPMARDAPADGQLTGAAL